MAPAFLEPLAGYDVGAYGGNGPISRDELISSIRDASGLIASATMPIDSGVLDAAPRLRVISNFGVGFDNVDLARATERGVRVTNTPGVLSDAVAELTIALMLQLSRGLPEAVRVVKEGRWDRSGSWLPLGTDLKDKTLAIIGMGRIGMEVARRALAFGMRVVYYDARADAPHPAATERATDLMAALRGADFVSLHTNLTAETRHLIGRRELREMKQTAFLVNTARGPIVDQKALYAALRAGEIAGAVLDVLEEEPPPRDEPLLSLPNVIITPHIGSATRETRAAMARLAVQNLLDCLEGRPCPNIVNAAL
jgi:glyoxylate reductase